MQDKMKKENIIMISILIIFFIVFGIFCQYARIIYDDDCLKEIARDYCIENNMTFYKSYEYDGFFYCNIDYNPRTEPNQFHKKFFFLDSEENNCVIKGRWSWRKN